MLTDKLPYEGDVSMIFLGGCINYLYFCANQYLNSLNILKILCIFMIVFNNITLQKYY